MNTINAETKPVFVVVSEEAGKSVTTVQAEQIVVVTAISRGPLGPKGDKGDQGGGAGYLHVQAQPSTQWIINHNLGFKPLVQLFDTASQEFDGLITHASDNQVIATLTAAVAGFARLT